eukprot:scaffold1842_cov148-Amphora_coffeaeformis.AAC.7
MMRYLTKLRWRLENDDAVQCERESNDEASQTKPVWMYSTVQCNTITTCYIECRGCVAEGDAQGDAYTTFTGNVVSFAFFRLPQI